MEGPDARVQQAGDVFGVADSPGVSAFAPPDSHKADEDTQDVAGPLRPSSPAGVINITPIRTKSALAA